MIFKIERDSEMKDCPVELMRLIREFNRYNDNWCEQAQRRKIHSMKFFLSEIADNVEWYRNQIEDIEKAIKATTT